MPTASLELERWNPATTSFDLIEPSKVNAICGGQLIDKSLDEQMCDIFVEQPINAFETAFFRANSNPEKMDNLVSGIQLNSSDDKIITNSHTRLTMKSINKKTGILTFTIADS